MRYALCLLLAGCYLEHQAEPCDAGLQADDAGFEPADSGSSPDSATYPGPCPFAYDKMHCWCEDPTHERCVSYLCEGPYVGCIAPGSPLSSTWKGPP